jgi:transposase
MVFAQMTSRDGLRDIATCLNARPETLYHLGFTEKIAKSTLAEANENRDWRIWEDLAKSLIRKARPLYAGEDIGIDLDNTIYALDSSTIDLSLTLFPCSGCGKARPGYDRMPRPREFEFIPVWNIPVSLSYTMRLVDCPACGIKVESVPWAQGKHACCDVHRHFLASWARRLSWKETAACFHTTWDTVCRSVKWVVDFGLKHRDLEDITAIGVDEVTYSKGHKYMTLVYQIDSGRKRLLGVIRDRDTQSLASFFETFGAERCAKIKVICPDMWKPYLNVIAVMLPAALNVLDRFHIAKKLGEAVDEVRRQEAKQLAADGYEPVLKNSRYCFLKRRSNLTIRQATKLRDLLKYDLKSIRALTLKKSFDAFWQYDSPRWAGWFLKKWCTRAMRSKLAPMKKFVGTLRNHEELLMNYFKAGKLYSSGIVEGLNLRINLCMRKAYGYRSFDLLQTSLYHTLGNLPEPKFTHRFC